MDHGPAEAGHYVIRFDAEAPRRRAFLENLFSASLRLCVENGLPDYPMALEGALKLKEISFIFARAFSMYAW